MGKLVEQALPTLFQGVSRQPDTVRLPGQVKEATNAAYSVVTGGFSKRTGTISVGAMSSVTASAEMLVGGYERDASEKYIIVIVDDDLYVYDHEGDEKTVTFPDGKGYLNGSDPMNNFAMVTIADYTFIVNKTVTVARGTPGGGTIKGSKQTFSDLPGSPTVNDIWLVTGKDTDAFTGYYVQWDGDVWAEVAAPDEANSWDASTLPHILVRQGDGTFIFSEATWDDRMVGDDELTPAPAFVGKTINDIVFFRDRFFIFADEFIDCSQAGDYFNLWPEKAVDVLDSDPFERTATTNKVNIIRYGVPFRRILFATSTNEQFELSGGDVLSERTAVFEPSTSYKASEFVRPVALGDVLYFVAGSDKRGILMEYFYDDAKLTNRAFDVSKHVEGYIPPNVDIMVGDTLTGSLVLKSADDPATLYVYRVYWEDDEKIMSSWAKWTLGGDDDTIKGVQYIDGHLYIIIDRDGSLYMEKMLLTDEFDDDASVFSITSSNDIIWPILLDRRVSLTGTYDAGNDWTTWTVPYAHGDNVKVVDNTGASLSVTFPTSTTVRADGDKSASACTIGVPFEMEVELSKQFVREAITRTAGSAQRAITTGRLQLKHFFFDYAKTGRFSVEITPKNRDTRTYKFTGRVVGESENIIGEVPIRESGTFRVPVHSNARTVRIVLKNDSHIPCTITSANWRGFFNEITRQE